MQVNICVFGDSISWGVCDPELGSWVTRLRNFCETKYENVNVYNLGINGETTTGLLKRVEVESKSYKPDIIIFAIGTNDSGYLYVQNQHETLMEDYKKNIAKLYKIAAKFAKKIIFIGLTNVDETRTIPWDEDELYANKSVKEYDDVIKDFCLKNKVKFILMDKLLENYDLGDGLHPDAQGYHKMFEAIKKELEPIIEAEPVRIRPDFA